MERFSTEFRKTKTAKALISLKPVTKDKENIVNQSKLEVNYMRSEPRKTSERLTIG